MTKNNQFETESQISDSAKTEINAVDRDIFIDAMSRVANSVNVVTTNGEAGKFGITVSAATSVTADPPSLLVCINEASHSSAAILKNGVFALNVLSSNQKEISELFAGRIADSPSDRFSIDEWTESKTTSPILSNAVAVFDCRVVETYKQGTHFIIIGQVVASKKGVGDPLIYSQRSYTHLKKNNNTNVD